MTVTKNKFRRARDAGMPIGTKLLAERMIEPYISIVIAEDDRQYVRWWFNHQTGGFFWGNYYQKKDALGGIDIEIAACRKVWDDFNEVVARRNRL